MKRVLLLLLISSSCLGFRGYQPVYREVQVDDVRDRQNREENDRLRRENERLQRVNVRPAVVYVRPYEPNFEWLTNHDMIILKYLACGLMLGILIFR